MAKVQIKSEKNTPFGEIFSGLETIWLHIAICSRPHWSEMIADNYVWG